MYSTFAKSLDANKVDADSDDDSMQLTSSVVTKMAEAKAPPAENKDDSNLSAEALKQFANAAAVRDLVIKQNRYGIVRAMLAHGLLTMDMLNPIPGQTSVFSFLVHLRQTPLADALLEKGLVSTEQVADSNRGSNAVAVCAFHAEWPLLKRLMAARLIPLAAFFKRSETAENGDKGDNSALAFIEAVADKTMNAAVDQYLYQSLGSAIANNDRVSVEKWLARFIATKTLTHVQPALDYLLQTLPAAQQTFAAKMDLLLQYVQRATSTDQPTKQAVVKRLVQNATQTATSITDNDQIAVWFQYANNREKVKPLFIVKRFLRSDDTAAWDHLLDEVGVIEKNSTPSQAQDATDNTDHSLLR